MIDMYGCLVYGIEPEKVIAALENGREAIRNGWCRKTSHRVINGQDHYCATGAAYCKMNIDEDLGRKVQLCASELLNQHYQVTIRDHNLRKFGYRAPDTLAKWNDTRSSKKPVLNLYGSLIELIKKKYGLQ